MYVCDRCGELREGDDLPAYTEDFGYDTGVGWCSCPQTMVGNCSCGGQFIKAGTCDVCKNYFDDSYNSVCETCKEENATFENALKFGDEDKGSVEINGLLLQMFSTNEIEEILKRELNQSLDIKKSDYNNTAKKYLMESEYYEDWLVSHKDEL